MNRKNKKNYFTVARSPIVLRENRLANRVHVISTSNSLATSIKESTNNTQISEPNFILDCMTESMNNITISDIKRASTSDVSSSSIIVQEES